MGASVEYDPKGSTGYRMDQLASAFDRVRDSRDWKAPIQALIPTADRPIVEQAVRWFTGTDPAFEPAPDRPTHLVVKAPGYRLRPAEAGELINGSTRPTRFDPVSG